MFFIFRPPAPERSQSTVPAAAAALPGITTSQERNPQSGKKSTKKLLFDSLLMKIGTKLWKNIDFERKSKITEIKNGEFGVLLKWFLEGL